MKVIAATLLLFFIDHSSTLAQGQGGMMESGGGGLGGFGQTKTKFVILLGPDLKPGEVPFLDAYDMARGHDPNVISLFIPVESISVDQKTPLPTQPGISVHVEYSNPLPGADGPTIIELESKVRSEAIRYGITTVETKLVEAGVKVRMFLRVGLPNGDLFGINIQKFAAAAETLDPDNPTIEVFDERPIHAKNGLTMGMGMAGYGGMSGGYGGMSAGMGMGSEMGGDGGEMGGMGLPEGIGSDASSPTMKSPAWASPSGSISDSDTYLSWSPGTVAARSTQTGDSWIEVKLSGDKMTAPTIGEKVCAFWSDNKAYAFSAVVGRWDVLPLNSPPDKPPTIVLDAQSAQIKTDDDIHIFTAASGRWSSRSKASVGEANGSSLRAADQVLSLSFNNQPASSSNQLIPTGLSLDHALNEAVVEKLVLQFKAATEEEVKTTLKGQLLVEIADSFELRQSMQSSEANLLAKKLALIEEQIKLRERNRETIIQQRLKKMTGETP